VIEKEKFGDGKETKEKVFNNINPMF